MQIRFIEWNAIVMRTASGDIREVAKNGCAGPLEAPTAIVFGSSARTSVTTTCYRHRTATGKRQPPESRFDRAGRTVVITHATRRTTNEAPFGNVRLVGRHVNQSSKG